MWQVTGPTKWNCICVRKSWVCVPNPTRHNSAHAHASDMVTHGSILIIIDYKRVWYLYHSTSFDLYNMRVHKMSFKLQNFNTLALGI